MASTASRRTSAINPQGRVPALRTDEGELLIQSPAIIEYLEERYPQAPLLSKDLAARAQRAGCGGGASVVMSHPLHNFSVLPELLRQWGHDETAGGGVDRALDQPGAGRRWKQLIGDDGLLLWS